jgi:hypothetical protein
MRHQYPRRQRSQQVVEVAVAAAGLVADLEATGRPLRISSISSMHRTRQRWATCPVSLRAQIEMCLA